MKFKLKKIRKEKKMNQEELAKKIGIARNTLSDYENQKIEITLEKAYKIAKILNIKIDEMCETDDFF